MCVCQLFVNVRRLSFCSFHCLAERHICIFVSAIRRLHDCLSIYLIRICISIFQVPPTEHSHQQHLGLPRTLPGGLCL